MSRTFFGVMSSSHHYTNPFTCPCRDPIRRESYSLSLGQRIFVVVMAILVAIPTYGVGGVLTFYVLSAAFKARNVVWVDYMNEYPSRRSGFVLFNSSYWGFPMPIYRGSNFNGYNRGGVGYRGGRQQIEVSYHPHILNPSRESHRIFTGNPRARRSGVSSRGNNLTGFSRERSRGDGGGSSRQRPGADRSCRS